MKMRRVCCDCGAVLSPGEPGALTTHTFCDLCLSKQMKQIEAFDNLKEDQMTQKEFIDWINSVPYNSKVIRLDVTQKKLIDSWLFDNRARYIELPYDASTCKEVKVLQGDGQQIGTIELWQAMKIVD